MIAKTKFLFYNQNIHMRLVTMAKNKYQFEVVFTPLIILPLIGQLWLRIS